MTIAALEALQLVELMDNKDRIVDISQFDPLTLYKKVEYYRDTRLRSVASDAADSLGNGDLAAIVSTTSARNTTPALLPSCFAYNRIYANDPLMKIARPSTEPGQALSASLGMDTSSLPNQTEVRTALSYFENLAPLIRCRALFVLPIEELISPTSQDTDGVPIVYSEDWFKSDVPPHLHDYVHQNVTINEVTPNEDGNGLLILDTEPKSPTRGISINFNNDGPVWACPFYLLMDTKIVGKTDDGVQIAQFLDWENPPDQPQFDAWRYQSINQAIIGRLRSVSREILIGHQLNATYLTESEFESKLLGMSYQSDVAPENTSAVNFLNANAPYLKLEVDPVFRTTGLDRKESV